MGQCIAIVRGGLDVLDAATAPPPPASDATVERRENPIVVHQQQQGGVQQGGVPAEPQYNDKGERVFSPGHYEARAAAEKHAKHRGELYDQSKAAYANNEKAQAKKLSDEAHKEGELMEQANEKAVRAIIDPQFIETHDTIDLHGLHVKEAVAETTTFVSKHQSRQTFKTLYIITGAGHHSKEKDHSVVKDAIVHLATEKGWKMEPDGNNPGKFHVFL